MSDNGGETISQKNDGKVWKFLLDVLEERMKRGEFTIIDATHAKTEAINRYKKLAQKYRYRVFVLDFSDVPLETALKRNKLRSKYKFVPEVAIMNSYERMSTEKIPSWVTVIKPEEFDDTFQFKPKDYSEWGKVHIIGDIHGCYDALVEYIGEIKEDELYIFCGDYLDRGIQNKEVLDFMISIYELPNVILLEGNHETHLRNWAHDEQVQYKEFIKGTQVELEKDFYKVVEIKNEVPVVQSKFQKFLNKVLRKEVPNKVEINHQTQLDKQALGEYKKEVRQFCRKLAQISYFTYNGAEIVVTHGGIAKKPDNFMFMSTEQLIRGVGDYSLDIDNVWEKNTIASEKVIQIRGHRNIYRLPIKASKNSFCLEGQVETGGNLRVVTLEKDA